MEEYKLFDAEYRFLSVIWELEPINSTELSRVCLRRLGWKKSTTFNMIRKLAERGFVKN
ncbi:MAG: MarR family transcriptional regulator, partial [Oscillospiraceae bacterium]|nr:MarR family transcriptional regulator [Oscillospiraceae bacterium]